MMKTYILKRAHIIVLLLLLSACGRKHDLYLPSDEQTGHGRDIFLINTKQSSNKQEATAEETITKEVESND